VFLTLLLVVLSSLVAAQDFDIDINDPDDYCYCDTDCGEGLYCLFNEEKYPHLFETHTKADDYVLDANQAGYNGVCVVVKLGSSTISMPLQTDCLYRSPNIPECTEDSDCNSGDECDDGECVEAPECRRDSDCEDGYECDNQECVEVLVVQEPEPEPVVQEEEETLVVVANEPEDLLPVVEPEVVVIEDQSEVMGHYEVQCVPVDAPTILASAIVILGFFALIGWIFYLVKR